MDPNETLRTLIEAATAGDADAMAQAAEDLMHWLDRGGAAPMPPHFAVHIDAGRDANGNARRAWIVCDASGNPVETVDEGCEGRAALRAKYPAARDTFRLPTTASYYRAAIRGDYR